MSGNLLLFKYFLLGSKIIRDRGNCRAHNPKYVYATSNINPKNILLEKDHFYGWYSCVPSNVTKFMKRGLPHTYNLLTLMTHNLRL